MYITLPTGVGKSVILAAVAARRLQAGRILVLIHRQDIATQLSKTFQQMDFEVGLVMQGHREFASLVVVATPQSLIPSMLERLIKARGIPIATIFIDEAHHAIAGSAYEHIITALESVYESSIPVIGFTATPYRSDKQSMLSLLPTCAFARDIPDMVRDGWLAPINWVPVHVEIDLSQVATRNQDGEDDYDGHKLSAHLVRTAITTAIVQEVAPQIEQRSTLVFAVTIEHAEQLAAAFCSLGFVAKAVSGRQSHAERERLFAAWRLGEVQIVCNCSLLTEGFDFPEIAALVIARPTRSPSLYVQMLGRGTRPAPGKQNCLVLDVVGNNPDTSRQIVLPDIVGDTQAQGGTHPTTKDASGDPLLKSILGTERATRLALLDPIGQSQYRWIPYQRSAREGYFAKLNKDETAILERDPLGSGLYRSRSVIKLNGGTHQSHWIQQEYLPLRQQVALVHEETRAQYDCILGSKEEEKWLTEPATAKQITALQRMRPRLARRIASQQWTKQKASDIMTYLILEKELMRGEREDRA